MRTGRPSNTDDARRQLLGGADNYGRKYGRPWDDETRGLYWCEAVFHQTWVSPIRPLGPSVPAQRDVLVITSAAR